MRSPGLGSTAILSLAACAATPNYGTGTAGTSGGGGGAGGAAGSYTPPALKVQHPNLLISHGAQAFAMPAPGSAVAVVNGAYHNGGWNAGTPTSAAPAWVAIKL